LGGLLTGIGINGLLIVYSVASFQSVVPAIVILVVTVLIGIVTGSFGPVGKQPMVASTTP
jgi:hypothetical protein